MTREELIDKFVAIRHAHEDQGHDSILEELNTALVHWLYTHDYELWTEYMTTLEIICDGVLVGPRPRSVWDVTLHPSTIQRDGTTRLLPGVCGLSSIVYRIEAETREEAVSTATFQLAARNSQLDFDLDQVVRWEVTCKLLGFKREPQEGEPHA